MSHNWRRIAHSLYDRLMDERIESLRLNAVMEGNAAEGVRLAKIRYTEGETFDMWIRGPYTKYFVALLYEWFAISGGVNYVEFTVSGEDKGGLAEELGPLVVRMQRVLGKTPNQLQREAERERDTLQADNAALRAKLTEEAATLRSWAAQYRPDEWGRCRAMRERADEIEQMLQTTEQG